MMTKKTFVLGAKGFIGSHFYNELKESNEQGVGTHHVDSQGFSLLNLESPSFDWEILSNQEYSHGLIAGGISRPLLCERNVQKSYACNVQNSLEVGEQLFSRGITPIFLSSDYVFDGTQRFYHPSNPVSPLNTYGEQKAVLEKKAMERFQGNCLIIRLGKVYGFEKGDGTLIDEIVQKLSKKEKVLAAYDQWFAPIFIQDVVTGIRHLQKERKVGIYHFAGPSFLTRLDLAKMIVQKMGVNEDLISPISLDELGDGIKRPKQTILISEFGKMSIEKAVEHVVRSYVSS